MRVNVNEPDFLNTMQEFGFCPHKMAFLAFLRDAIAEKKKTNIADKVYGCITDANIEDSALILSVIPTFVSPDVMGFNNGIVGEYKIDLARYTDVKMSNSAVSQRTQMIYFQEPDGGDYFVVVFGV